MSEESVNEGIIRNDLRFDLLFPLGFGCFLSVSRRSFFGIIFSSESANAAFNEGLSVIPYVLFMALSLIFVVIFFSGAKKFEKFLSANSTMMNYFAGSAALGIVLLSLCGMFSQVTEPVRLAGVVLFSFGTIMLPLAWISAAVSRQVEAKHFGKLIAVSYIVSTLLAWGLSFSIEVVQHIGVIVCVCMSVFLLPLCPKNEHPQQVFDMRELCRATSVDKVFVTIAFLLASVMLGCNFNLSLGNEITSTFFELYAFLLIACLTVIILIDFLAKNPTLLFLVEAICIFAFMALFFFTALIDSQWFIRSASLIVNSRLILELLLWLMLYATIIEKNISLVRSTLVVVGIRAVSDILVNLAIPQLLASSTVLSDVVYKVSLALFFMACLSFLFIKLRAYTGEKRFSEVPTGSEHVFEETVAAISQRYALSNREREILAYTARGYSSRWVAEKFCLSTSTVQTHVKNIYAKTGVHNKSELIAFVNGFAGGAVGTKGDESIPVEK